MVLPIHLATTYAQRFMKRNILLIITLLMGLCPVMAGTHNQTFQDGAAAYSKGDYTTAIVVWQSILDDGQESGELYYNLGNAYYRLGDYAHAILNYERAARLMPRDKETKENLALAYSKTEDRIEQMPRLFFIEWWQAAVQFFSPRGWMWIALSLLALTGAAVTLFFLSRDYRWRKGTFVTSLTLGVLLLVSAVLVAASASRASKHNEAIVVAPMTVVKSSPDQGGMDKFVLHEGAHLQLGISQDGWTKIEINDGNTGWLPSEDFEII